MFSQLQSKTALRGRYPSVHWQARRGYLNAQRLGYSVRTLATAYGATCLPPDETVQARFDHSGIGADAIALVRFRISDLVCTVAVPTIRTWERRDRRGLASTIAEAAFAAGRNVIVVPPRDVIREPRLSNATRIGRSMRPPAAGDLEILRNCIAAGRGTASLKACEDALSSPYARARIFGLMAGGSLGIDLDDVLGRGSTVQLRPEGWVFDWDVLGWQPIRPGWSDQLEETACVRGRNSAERILDRSGEGL